MRVPEDTPGYLPQALLGLVGFPGARKVFIVLLRISCHEPHGLLGLVKGHKVFVGRGAGCEPLTTLTEQLETSSGVTG